MRVPNGILPLFSLLILTFGSSGNMQSLASFKYTTFPIPSIKATGWLQNQLELSASGLGGHLFDFYRYVERSSWFGGTQEYSELNEAAPYWFNYIVPLAWTLDDSRLKTQAKKFLDYTIEHQAKDGWLGPETMRQTRGIWARALLLFGMIQYAEADPTETERIVECLHKFVPLLHSMLKDNFTGLIQDKAAGDRFDPFGFGLSRTHELPISLMWLYENYPSNNAQSNNSQLIWESMELMFEGGRIGGRDWTTFFVDGVFPTAGTPNIHTSGFTHGVNLAQGLRYPSVLYRMTKEESLVQQTYDAVRLTSDYQTTLAGSISGDEHLGAQSPQRGSETCMAVESIFTYAYLYRFHGANDFADRAERVAFNAFPAAISGDWWSHQYVQQTNQPWSKNLTGQPFFNVVPYSNTFGLEPNFPCCTVNHPQAYPKFVASSYVKSGNNGIVHMLLGPTSLNTKIKDHEVEIICNTNYPFSNNLRYQIISNTSFDFAVRIPSWVESGQGTSATNGEKPAHLSPDDSALQHYDIKPGHTSIDIRLPQNIRVKSRDSNIAIYRGALLYALDIPHTTSSHQPLNWTDGIPLSSSNTHPKSKDWVFEPTEPWQFAVDANISTMEVKHVRDEDAELPHQVWTNRGPPTVIEVDGYAIEWPESNGTASDPPKVVFMKEREKKRLTLIPYGAAKLHIAEFPVAQIDI